MSRSREHKNGFEADDSGEVRGVGCGSGFSLIELLVVIGIIALLASLLLPTFSRGKRSAQAAVCLSNLHQVGIGLQLYIEENENRLPVCAQLPSLNSNLPPITSVLEPQLKSKQVFECPADRKLFPVEKTSYEWNHFLNGASYDRPEGWSPVTQAIVEQVFGGRLNTPLVGDADPVHVASAQWLGKNALFFDGRVDKTKRP
jgi:prepilin-type N-terminal cleavage/methylation domain-containing protein